MIVFMMSKGWTGYGMRVWQGLFEGVVAESTTFWVSGVGDGLTEAAPALESSSSQGFILVILTITSLAIVNESKKSPKCPRTDGYHS